MIWVAVVVAIVAVVCALFTLACCVIAARADDRMMNEFYRELEDKE